MKALIVYHSKNGTTQKMAQEISNQLKKRNTEVKVSSIHEITQSDIEEADRLYLGCWTSGHMIFGQKPEQTWVDFATRIPESKQKQTVLFTT